MKITSVNNELVKETAKLLKGKYRDESGLFILEGNKCIEEALSSGIEVIRIFSIEGFEDCSERIEVSEPVLAKISETKSAPKSIAVAKQPQHKWSKSFQKVLLLEGIKDAGNLGTILRTATAFGVDAIVLYGDTVDLYNPKCVRSAVGNLWKTPIFSVKDFSWLENNFKDFGRIATLPKSDDSIWLKDYCPVEKTLIMFGSEANGLSDDLKSFATQNVTIEMSKNVESLNLAISVGVFLYKISL